MYLSSVYFRQYLAKVAFVAITYFSSAWLTISLLGLGTSASPVWPPAGIALAALLFWGERVWVGVFLGDMLMMLVNQASWGLMLSSALGSTLSVIIGAKLLRYFQFSTFMSRLRDVLVLVLLAAAVSPVINATVDIAAQSLAGKLDWQGFWQHWWILWLGDSTGILVSTPLLLRLRLGRRELFKKQPRQRLIEVAICFGLLGIVSWVVFAGKNSTTIAQYPLEYLPFPFVVWAAIRFQTWGAIFASLLVSILAIAGALQGVGPFIVQTANPHQAIILLQTFMAIITITALFLSVTVSERQRAEKQLRTTLERDRLLAEVALRIRQSLDLEQILNTTVVEIRNLLQVDRVYFAYLKEHQQVQVIAESVVPSYASLLNWIFPTQLVQEIQTLLSQKKEFVVNNIAQANLSLALRDYYQRYQVKAVLTVPLMVNNQPLGLLVAHQCSRNRYWYKSEVKLLEQLSTQVSIAIQQAQLYQQVQTFNTQLEEQVKERTLQLQGKIEEVQQLDKMKTVFLQAVSHDLRTSIMGLLMLLKKLQNRSGENLSLSRSVLERIVQSSDRSLTLINALSEDHFSEHRSLILHCQQLSLKQFVENTLEDWQLLFRKNQAILDDLIPDNLPSIYADSIQLKCVFNNLLTNALKHNPPGTNLTIAATIEGEMVRCTLTDNGVGMEQQQCEQLFKLYVRSVHNQRLTGIGLGSYQCRQIIEAHGGRIGVNSIPNVGSQFWFTLPLAESNKVGRLLNY